jgi:hypothetical protein
LSTRADRANADVLGFLRAKLLLHLTRGRLATRR